MRAFSQSLPMELMRAREAVMRYFRPLLAEHGLTEQQWRVLRALSDASDEPEVAALAQQTCLLGPSLSRILIHLESRGLIDKATVPEDARRSRVWITSDGIELVAVIAPQSEARYQLIEEAVGPDRLEELYELLAVVASMQIDVAGIDQQK